MDLNKLSAISPVDGRYRNKTEELSGYFSEFGLIKYRLKSELEYFISLCELPLPGLEDFKRSDYSAIRAIADNFSPDKAERIKEIESVTNHDVKAVEYYLKEQFNDLGLSSYSEYIHFGLTSQDINNTATPLSIKEFYNNFYEPLLFEIRNKIDTLAEEWNDIPMLARTHGQPASPTRLGKELKVFAVRLDKQFEQLKFIPWSAKFGGATGNFNAHKVAYPGIDWNSFADKFLNDSLGLERSYPTTQIDHYDNLAAWFDCMARINTILLDFSKDIWTYISFEYFKQKIVKGEIGSSAMPHKVNPIDFENAEGNLGIANSLFRHFSGKLPVSRLQRDLSDSTVLRNTGVPIAHTFIAIKSLIKGMGKLIVNTDKINSDLDNNWAVVAEAIQTILRREGYPKPYEALLGLTRTNEKITREIIHAFIDGLDITDSVKVELKAITPFNYTGL